MQASKPVHHYTKDQLAWCKENRSKYRLESFADQFNLFFCTELSASAIKGFCKRNNIFSDYDPKFKKGIKPANMIQKGQRLSPKTEFKKGQAAHNVKPVGTEMVKADGYVWVKLGPKEWRQKHKIIWEQHYGEKVKLPYILMFKDCDPTNVTIDNLIKINQAEHLQIQRNQYKKQHEEIKPSILALSKLQVAIFKNDRGNQCPQQ